MTQSSMDREYTLITGASKGLGRFLAVEFAINGHNLILSGRDSEGLMQTAQLVNSKSPCAVVQVVGDLENLETRKELERYYSQVNVFLNNAADTTAGKKLEEIDSEKITKMIQTNLTIPIIMTRQLYSSRQGKPLTIINMNSLFSLEDKVNSAVYSATKAGLRQFSRCFRLESSGRAKIIDIFPTKMRVNPGINYGMDGEEVAQKICGLYRKGLEGEFMLDGRPEPLRPVGIKHPMTYVEIEKKS